MTLLRVKSLQQLLLITGRLQYITVTLYFINLHWSDFFFFFFFFEGIIVIAWSPYPEVWRNVQIEVSVAKFPQLLRQGAWQLS